MEVWGIEQDKANRIAGSSLNDEADCDHCLSSTLWRCEYLYLKEGINVSPI
jgi:hypothetical protein